MIGRRTVLRRALAIAPALVNVAACGKLFSGQPAVPTAPYRKVFLFSGHMVDAPDRPTARFPASKEPVAASAIAATLDSLVCGASDLGICGGACGGDLIFAELVLARGAHLEMLLPFDEETFLHESVDFAGPQWRQRFFAVKDNPLTTTYYAPEALGSLPKGMDPYERENRWLLDTALAHGPAKVDFICLWNGGGGDGPGGTKHMVDEVKARGARVYWLDTRTLWDG